MKKSLVSLLVFALVFTMVAPAFAQVNDIGNSYAKEEIEALIEAGIIGGYEDGTFKPANAITRAEFAKILALSLELEENAAAANVFTDVPAWAKGYVGALVEAELTTGLTATTYGSSQNITREQLATFFVRAFGYEEAAEELDLTPSFNDAANVAPYAKANVAFASEIGFINGLPNGNFDPKGNAQRQAVARLAYEFYFNADEYHAAAEEVIKDNAPVPATLEVVEVTANNLKTFSIELSKAASEESVTTSTVSVTNRTLEEVILSEDGTKITGVFATTLPQSVEIEIKVDGVKSLDRTEEIKDFKEKHSVTDTVVPQLLSAEALNAKQVKLSFNKPVNFNKPAFEVLGNIKIDEKSVTAKAVQDYENNTVTLTLTSPLKPGTYALEVSDIADYATYKIAKAELEITVAEDTEAPSIVDARAVKLDQIEVTFNEAIDRLANGSFGTFKVNGTDIPRSNVEEVVRSSGTKFRLNLTSELNLAATVEVKVSYKGQKDMAGNEVKDEQTFTFKVEDDTTLPTASVEVQAGNKVVVTFSKPMLKTEGTIRLLNSNGTQRAAFTVASKAANFKSNDSVLELSAAELNLSSVDAVDFTLNIKDMKDATVRKNLLPEQNLTFTARDTNAPSVYGHYTVTAGNNVNGSEDKITFYFTKAMDEDTLKNLSNYVREGSPNAPFVTISGVKNPVVASDKKSVTITYPGAAAAGFNATFTVYGVKDAAGNMLALKDGITKGTPVEGGITITNTEATAVNKVTVTFSTYVYSVDPSALRVTGPNFSTYFVSASVDANDASKVTFTTAGDLPSNTTDFKVVANNYTLLKDVVGSTLAQGAERAVTDKIKPEFDRVVAGNKVITETTTTPNVFTIYFTEEVKGTDFLNDLVVRSSNGTRITNLTIVGGDLVNGTDKVAVQVNGLSNGFATLNVTFPIVSNITDLAGNDLAEKETATSVTVEINNN